jgi:hypothetical protein
MFDSDSEIDISFFLDPSHPQPHPEDLACSSREGEEEALEGLGGVRGSWNLYVLATAFARSVGKTHFLKKNFCE